MGENNNQRMRLNNESGNEVLFYKALPIQKRLYYLQTFDKSDVSYNEYFIRRVVGKINIEKLEEALYELVRRHDALRTTYELNEYEIMARVHANCDFKVNIINVENKDESHVLNEIDRAVNTEINLDNCPNFKVNIYAINDRLHYFLFVTHHITFDEQSERIFISELNELYARSNEGMDNLSCERTIRQSFYEYVSLKTAFEKSEEFYASKKYWMNVLAELSEQEILPIAQKKVAAHHREKDVIKISLSSELTKIFKDKCKELHGTLFIGLLLALKILIYRYTDNSDVVVATPMSGRAGKEYSEVIGCFTNIILLRTKFSGETTLTELFEIVKNNCFEAVNHRGVSIDDITDMFDSRAGAVKNISNILFAYHEKKSVEEYFLGLPSCETKLANEKAKYDITFNFAQSEGELVGEIEFDSVLYKKEDVAVLSEHYLKILSLFIDYSNQRINYIDFRTPREIILQNKLINIDVERIQLETFTELFQVAAEKYKNNCAATFSSNSITYQDLNLRSSQMANWILKESGFRTATIGLYVNRNIEMLISIIAIFKAGMIYVPIDTDLPKERIKNIIEDASINILMCDEDTQEKDEINQIQCKKINISDVTVTDKKCERSGNEIQPGDVAYILFTSGSTGRPKGVQITHQSLANFLHSMRKCPGFDETDKTLALTTISFDISILELLAPLISGGEIVIAEKHVVGDPFEIKRLIEYHQITICQATPSTWRLLDSIHWDGSRNLKILCGGESLDENLAANLTKRVKELWNMYGPTETTIWSSTKKIVSQVSPMTVGKPIDNTSIYILSKYYQHQPVNIYGELYIGGDGVSKGYINREELTKERFLPDQNNHLKTNMYRTGDMARILPSGEIQINGRLDNQIKLNGYRIELEEIDNCLNKNDHIKEAASILKRGDDGVDHIISFYVHDSENASEANLKDYLHSHLPGYMIPKRLQSVKNIPKTINRKIDRNALDKIKIERQIKPENDNKPKGIVERKILKICEETISSKNFSLDNTFFDLGGNSLLSLKFIYHIQKYFGVAPSPREVVFQTLRQICENIEGSLCKKENQSVRPIFENIEPLYFESQGNKLYATITWPAEVNKSNKFVILCYPIGNEYIRTHRAFRVLASMLSQCGYPVMRFDYYGTGDSGGDAIDLNLNTMIKNLNDAVAEMSRLAQRDDPIIIGSRIGATITYLNSLSHKNSRLILWDMVLTGNSYLQHDKYMSEFYSDEFRSQLFQVTVERLKKVSLGNYLFVQSHQLQTDDWLEFKKEKNINVKYNDLVPIWATDPTTILVPGKILDSIVNWIYENEIS